MELRKRELAELRNQGTTERNPGSVNPPSESRKSTGELKSLMTDEEKTEAQLFELTYVFSCTQHRGAKFTKAYQPVKLVYIEEYDNEHEARMRVK